MAFDMLLFSASKVSKYVVLREEQWTHKDVHVDSHVACLQGVVDLVKGQSSDIFLEKTSLSMTAC